MNLTDYSDSYLSLLVPIVTIVLAFKTGRVILSLLSGALLGALMLNGLTLEAVDYLFNKFSAIFITDGAIDIWTLNIFLFLIFLGSMTALLAQNGATKAFAKWAHNKIASRRGASLFTVILGILLFIDDYFNALGVGAVSRPVTDSFKISRAKLAYLIDSTSAPMVILTPISSWGGYIIALLGTTFAANNIEMSSLSAYIQMIPMNFYAILTIALVLYTAYTNFNIGPMQEHEANAMKGQLFDPQKVQMQTHVEIIEGEHGNAYELVLAITILVFVTIASIFWTGYRALEIQEVSFVNMIEHSDVGLSLVYGSATALVSTLLFSLSKPPAFTTTLMSIFKGAFTMKDALTVLTAAWLIGAIIKDLETGTYIASVTQEHLNLALLPLLIFLLSALMAFATGTSWGTFGIMIGITTNIALSTDPSELLILVSAVLSGAVMGDHCSPISDTTILSSVGAQSNHIDHVKTQLPYALVSGAGAVAGFLTLGITANLVVAWTAAVTVFIMLIFIIKQFQATQTQ